MQFERKKGKMLSVNTTKHDIPYSLRGMLNLSAIIKYLVEMKRRNCLSESATKKFVLLRLINTTRNCVKYCIRSERKTHKLEEATFMQNEIAVNRKIQRYQ